MIKLYNLGEASKINERKKINKSHWLRLLVNKRIAFIERFFAQNLLMIDEIKNFNKDSVINHTQEIKLFYDKYSDLVLSAKKSLFEYEMVIDKKLANTLTETLNIFQDEFSKYLEKLLDNNPEYTFEGLNNLIISQKIRLISLFYNYDINSN
ncbi:MAG: hypothetical protein WAX04_06320 [Oscillospiraceae bacterium]